MKLNTFQQVEFDKLQPEPLNPQQFLDWVTENFDPEDVFSIKELEIWAENNDWIRKEG